MAKQIIVDQVDSMETTLAHLFPEMTANITAAFHGKRWISDRLYGRALLPWPVQRQGALSSDKKAKGPAMQP